MSARTRLAFVLGALAIGGMAMSLGIASSEGSDTEATQVALKEQGAEVYTQYCAACHGPDGSGGSGPALGPASVESAGRVIRQVLYGSAHMPAFENVLENEEVAAVATYVRSSFDNDFEAVDVEAVEQTKAQFE